jgi:magnesium and cobalt transporter
MSKPVNLFERLKFLLRRRAGEHRLRDEIAELVQEAEDHPDMDESPLELDPQERALIANVLHLRGTTVDDLMVPRADIVAMEIDTDFQKALAQIRSEGHSRMPVYREQMDDIVGMIHIKDVFAYVGRPEAFRLEDIVRKPLLVSPQTPVLDMLLQMRQAHMHMALVIDEYGGIDGLVTIEDLVETIVGDISDEHDELERPLIMERAEGVIDLEARLPIEEFEARFGAFLTDDEREADIDTVGGLVVTMAGRVPARGEVITHPSGWEFRILEADARRIRRMRTRRPA